MSASKISQEEFDHIAKLSRLTIAPGEEFIKDQLAQAADYVAVLQELNGETKDLPPTYQVNHKQNALRDDVVTPSLTQDQALSQASQTQEGYFKTSATINKNK